MDSKCLKNLHVAFDGDGKSMGMIEKPVDSEGVKNYWRMYIGVGENSRFIGHAVNKKEACNHVHWAIVLESSSVVNV